MYMHVRVCMYSMSVHIIIMSIHMEFLPCGEISMAVFYWNAFAEMCSKGSGILRCSEILRKFVIYPMWVWFYVVLSLSLFLDKVQIESQNIHIQSSVSTYTCSLLLVYHKF